MLQFEESVSVQLPLIISMAFLCRAVIWMATKGAWNVSRLLPQLISDECWGLGIRRC